MELTKDINFNLDKLTKGETFTINYFGKLVQEGSEDVFITYGYGENWNNTTELKMNKTTNGFSAEITPLDATEFNFCFRNGNNIWDNNSYQNYTVNIETPVENNIENLISEIELNLSEPVVENKVEEISISEEAEIVKEEIDIETTERKTFNIDAIIEEILNTEITPTIEPIVENKFEQEIKEEKIIIPSENPTHVNKTSLLVEDVLVPFYTNEDNSQFLPVDTQTYSKFFTFRRKIKLALYRILHTIPKLITGNYKKKRTHRF